MQVNELVDVQNEEEALRANIKLVLKKYSRLVEALYEVLTEEETQLYD